MAARTWTVGASGPAREGTWGASTRLVPWLLGVSWLLVVALTLAQQLLTARVRGTEPDPAGALVLISGWIGVAVAAVATFALLRRRSDRGSRDTVGLAAALAVGGLVFTVAYGGGLSLAVKALVPTRAAMDPAELFVRSWLAGAPAALLAFLATAGAVEAASALDRRRRVEIEVSRLDGLLTEARLDALRARLRPHFLFNALNAATALSREGESRKATHALEHLGRLLRTTLRHESRHEVTLGEELRLVADYLALEQIRFGERLRTTRAVEPDAERAAVPAFLLLPLVENAVKHGLGNRHGGHVRISARRDGALLRIAVEDDGPGPVADAGSAPLEVTTSQAGSDVPPVHAPARSGHRPQGLLQARERLRMLHGDRACLALRERPGGGTVADVVVPYREEARC